MKCSEVLALFSRYLENDIDQLTRTEIEQHLMQCTSCSNELSIFSKSLSILNAAAKLKAPRQYKPN